MHKFILNCIHYDNEDGEVEKINKKYYSMKNILILLLLFITLIGLCFVIFCKSFNSNNLSNIDKETEKKHNLMENRKQNINRILSDTQINTWTDNNQLRPKISTLSNGNFVIIWQSYLENGIGNIYGQIFYSNGAKKGNEFHISNYTTLDQTNKNVASSSSGKFMVIWQQSDNTIFGQIFINDGTKLNGQFLISTNIGYSPSIIILANDNFFVTWNNGNYICAQIFTNNGKKVGLQINLIQQSNYISTTSLANGNFVMIYGRNYNTYAQIFYSNGTMLKLEFIVNNFINSTSISSISNSNFMIVWESLGQDIIGGSDYGIYGQIFTSSGAKIGNEFRVNTYIIGNQGNPSITSLANDNYIVTWQSNNQDGNGLGVYGQILDSTGNKIGNEFKVNTFTIDDQSNPSASLLINTNFVVVWDSGSQDGSGWGIFGNIYQSDGSIIGFNACPLNCQSCINSTNCKICDPNFELLQNELCGCFDGFYLDISSFSCISKFIILN